MPRKRIKRTPTPKKLKKLDTDELTHSLLNDVLGALESLRGIKLTRDDGSRGLLPSFVMLSRTALEYIQHIEARQERQAMKLNASKETKPPAIIQTLDSDSWAKEVRDAHIPKATISD